MVSGIDHGRPMEGPISDEMVAGSIFHAPKQA